VTTSTAVTTKVTVEGATGEIWGGNASRVTISATGKPTVKYLATPELVILEAVTGQPAKLVCQ
jgi:hypothetical protein